MHQCANPKCNNLTENPKFCSRSCAAIINNKVPKRKARMHQCKVCGIKLPGRRILCDAHNPQVVDWSKVTLREASYTPNDGYGNSNRYTKVRDNAQYVYKRSDRFKCCEKCSYDKHYHICHIKSVHLFDLDTPISVINSLDNLIALCPNCHWELDNGLFSPGGI